MEDIRQGLCPICRHNRVIEARPSVKGDQGLAPVAAAFPQGTGVFDGLKEHGVLFAYICQRCGFTQWFAANPGEIPIFAWLGTRLIEGPPQDLTPYR